MKKLSFLASVPPRGDALTGLEDTDEGLGVLETLVRRSRLFPYQRVYYYLFSKSGFTKGCIDRAKEMGNVALVKYRDMLA